MPSDARAALIESRLTGAPFLAVLLGTRAVRPTPADLELTFEHGPVGVADLAMLADLAIGGALRSRLGFERSLPTVTLALQLDEINPAGDVRARAWGGADADGVAGGRAEIRSGERVVGRALATFAVPSGVPAATPLPWEQPIDTVARREIRLTDADEAVLAALATRDPNRPRTDHLLEAACTAGPAGVLTCRPTSALLNRAGYLQGAALFGLAAAAAREPVDAVPARLSSAQLTFLAAATAADPVHVQAVLLQGGRRTFFVRSELRQRDRPVAEGTFVFRIGRQPGSRTRS